jgi:RimJ/RimL family protein N-acetyltransferase
MGGPEPGRRENGPKPSRKHEAMSTTKRLRTARLTLIASTAEHLRTELGSPERLADLLEAVVSPDWPTGEYDRDAMEYFLARLEEGGEDAEGWFGWYALSEDAPGGSPALVGAAGYFGPPGADGTVEIGYSVLPDWQGRGLATEMARMLVAHAFTFPGIQRVIAHTREDNPASVKVLQRAGFRAGLQAAGEGAEPGTVRFEQDRPLQAPAAPDSSQIP